MATICATGWSNRKRRSTRVTGHCSVTTRGWRWLSKTCTIAGCATSGWPGRMNPMPPDLSTTYLGLQLASPLVPSASPLSRSLDTIRRMEDAGAAAIVLHSLFEEQIELESTILDRYLNASADSSYWEAI